MKKIVLKTGIITLGMISALNNDIKVCACEYEHNIQTEKRRSEEEKLVSIYSKVYELDEEVVINKFREMTGNFLDWKEQHVIVNENLSNYDYKYYYNINDKRYDNLEIAVLETVRNISRNPGNYDLTYEDVSSYEDYTTDKCGEEILKYYCDLLKINESAALPIMYEECYTDLSSYAYVYQGNPGGMGPGNTYKNIEVGIIEFIYLLKNSCSLNCLYFF